MLAWAESNFSNFKFEYLLKNEFLRKTILACSSGAQMGSINKKGRKSCDTAPLNQRFWQAEIVALKIPSHKYFYNLLGFFSRLGKRKI